MKFNGRSRFIGIAPFLLALAALAAAPCAASAEDWPQYRKDDSRSGISGDPLPAPLKEIWKLHPPVAPQPAWELEAKADKYSKIYDLTPRQTFDYAHHPVIAGGRVFYGSTSQDKVECLQASDGKRLWVFFTEGPVRFAPVVVGDRVYFGSDDGHVYCLEASSGKLIWKQRPVEQPDRRQPGNERMISAWPIRTGLIVREGMVYGSAGVFPSQGVWAVALKAGDGQVAWRSPVELTTLQGYGLASPGKLYLPAGRNNPVIFERSSGKLERIVEGAGGTWALLAGDQLVFGPGRKGELGNVEPGRSDQLATFSGLHMIVHQGSSYLHSRTQLSALDRTLYLKLASERRTIQAQHSAATERLKKLGKTPPADQARQLRETITSTGAQIDALTRRMGECTKWQVNCDNPYDLIAAGDLLITGGDNRIQAFAMSDGALRWTQPVNGKAYALAAAGGRLLVGTDKGTIHCFGDAR